MTCRFSLDGPYFEKVMSEKVEPAGAEQDG